MKRFRFRLSRVRRVRSIEVDVARGELQAALARRDAAEAARRAVREAIDAFRTRWRDGLAGDAPLAPDEVLTIEAEVERLLAAETEHAKRVRVLEQDVERHRRAWAERRTAERALELLEERRRREHRIEERRTEAAEADETASRRTRNRFQREEGTVR